MVDQREHLLRHDRQWETWHAVALPAPQRAVRPDFAHAQVFALGRFRHRLERDPISDSRYHTFFDVSDDFGKTWTVRAGPEGSKYRET